MKPAGSRLMLELARIGEERRAEEKGGAERRGEERRGEERRGEDSAETDAQRAVASWQVRAVTADIYGLRSRPRMLHSCVACTVNCIYITYKAACICLDRLTHLARIVMRQRGPSRVATIRHSDIPHMQRTCPLVVRHCRMCSALTPCLSASTLSTQRSLRSYCAVIPPGSAARWWLLATQFELQC